MSNLAVESVKLTNFRLHEDLEFSFEPNRFVSITGNNGSGKTTILSGLTWAWYDVTCDGVSGDKVVRKRSGKNTVVTVHWRCGEERYTVHAHRKHHKFKNRRILLKNDIDISCNTEAETLKLIEEITMPKDVFMNCLLFSQFVKNGFTDLTHAGQRKIIDKMLLLDCYDQYDENTSTIMKSSQAKLVLDELTVGGMETEWLTKEQVITREEGVLVDTVQALETEMVTARGRGAQLKKNYVGLNGTELKKQLEELNKENTELSGKVSTIESQVEGQRELCAAELKDSRSTLNSTRDKALSTTEHKYGGILATTKDTIHQCEKDVSHHEKERSDLTAAIERRFATVKQEKLTALETEVFPLNEQHQSLVLDSLKLDEVRVNAEVDLKKCEIEKIKCDDGLEGDTPSCVTCGQDLESDKALKQVQKLSTQIQDNITELTQTLELNKTETIIINDKLSKQQSTIDKVRDKYAVEIENLESFARKKQEEIDNNCNSKVPDIQITISKLKIKLSTQHNMYNAEVAAIKVVCNKEKVSADTEIKQTHRSKAQGWIDELSILKSLQSNVNESLTKVNEDLEKVNDISNELAGLKSKVEELKKSIKRSKTEHIERVNILQKEIDDLKEGSVEYQTNITKIERRLKILEFWKKGFSGTGIKAILLDETVPILNEKARELCAMVPMLRVRFDSQTQLKSGESRNKFEIDVLHTQNLSNREELSAGEKRMSDIIVLMCLRHLLEIIQDTKINILLLDEILDSLDPDNAAIAVGMAKELSNDHCVVLISHTLRDFIEADESLQM